MNVESKRIFISDLPENTTEDEIREKFNRFGKVTLIDIKQRKDIGPKNRSQFFAFINVDIDHCSLDQCFQEFSNKKWKGYYVEIQLAKESFLDRLKKERAEAGQINKTPEPIKPAPQYTTPVNGVKLNGKKYDSSDSEDEKPKKKISKQESSSSSSDDDDDKVIPTKKNGEIKKVVEKIEDVYADIVVKNNKFKKIDNKIESFGFEPIVKIEKAKPKSKDPKRMEADQKRLNSMMEMKRGYQNMKSTIQAALSKVDFKPKNKITFDDNNKPVSNIKKRKQHEIPDSNKKKKNLFNEEGDENDHEEFNFDVKKQFAGKEGQKLFELQNRFKNDSRFQMDERFADGDEEEGVIEEEMTHDEEKRKQLEILGEVLGTKFTPKYTDQNKKSMLRFDPSQPEHSKYEMKDQQPEKKKKRKLEDKKIEELPKVSDEKFYQVQDSLKDAFQEPKSFSLLNMFGRNQTDDKEVEEEEDKMVDLKPQKKNDLEDNRNPFKYDSSDDEDDKETNVKDIKNVDDNKTKHANVGLGPSRLWTESFFFKDDDYRFQEGIDFIKKLEVDEKEEFGKIRRDLKTIVQAKVKNNQRNNKPFKKKLGGASRRKKIRVNKALKR